MEFVIGALVLLWLSLRLGFLDHLFDPSKSKKEADDPWSPSAVRKRHLARLKAKEDWTKPEAEAATDTQTKKKQYLYYKQNSLFTPTEMKFLKELQKAVGDDYVIMGKVRMADVFGIRARQRSREYMSHFGKIKAKHFDFVLCCPETMSPLIAIELDDPSHDRVDRIRRDEFVDRVCLDVKLPILHQRTSMKYDYPRLREKIDALMNRYL